MKRTIRAYNDHFKKFFDSLAPGEQGKVLYILALLKTQDRIPSKFIQLIETGLYELRIEYEGNIFRVFFCFDGRFLVILFSGFQKKTQKTPPSEIRRAKKLMKEYYATKRM
jgi:phage-related protein